MKKRLYSTLKVLVPLSILLMLVFFGTSYACSRRDWCNWAGCMLIYSDRGSTHEGFYCHRNVYKNMYGETIIQQEEYEFIGNYPHVEQTVYGTPATCTTNGLTNGVVCSLCHHVIVAQTEIIASGHTQVADPEVIATCTTPGLTAGAHCGVCGLVMAQQQVIPALGHHSVIDSAVAATCSAPGKTQGSHCSVCGEVLITQETIPALPHTVVTDAGTAATCTTIGLTDGSHCSVCGTVITAQQTIPANGHTVVTDAGTAATCTATGLTDGSHCSVCGTVITAQQTIPAKGHTVVTDAGTAATCTATGLTDGSHCSACGTVITAQQTIPAKGHTVVTDARTEATCTASGLTEGSHCSVCGTVLTAQQTIPATGHTTVIDAGTAATCTTSGLTDGSHCSVCGTVITAQQTIPAKGHTVVTDAGTAATCTTTGLTEGSHCSVCGVILTVQQTIPSKGHDYKASSTEPTCTEKGYNTYTCSKCGHSYSDVFADALGHKFGSWQSSDNKEHIHKCLRDDCSITNTAPCDVHYEYEINGITFTLCPICIDFGGIVLDEAVNISIELPEDAQQLGNLIIHGTAFPYGTDKSDIHKYNLKTVIYAFSVAFEEDGRLVEWENACTITCDLPFEECEFDLVRIDMTEDGTQSLVLVEYELAEGIITFQADDNAMYLVFFGNKSFVRLSYKDKTLFANEYDD